MEKVILHDTTEPSLRALAFAYSHDNQAVDGELEEWVCGLPVGFVVELGRARLVNVVHGNPDSLSGWALGARNHPVAPSDPLREATTHLVA